MGLNDILKPVPLNVRNYLLTLLVENISEGVLLEDAEGKISFANPRAAETMVRKDGSLFPADLSVIFITDDLREPVAFMFVIRDIAENKKAQEEQMKLEEKRSDFIDKTAHEQS